MRTLGMNNIKTIASILLLASFVWLSAGCANHTEDVSAPKHQDQPGILDKTDKNSAKESAKKPKGIEISSPDNEKNGKDQNNKKKYDVTEPFNASKPSLMGFQISDHRDKVIQKIGKPNHEFMMNDAVDPITVYEYPGFSIGFDQRYHIAFIEVSSSNVNPGLNGLRIGQTAADAIKALGKSDFSSDYVISYQSNDVVLKMDLDPTSQTISSIKLFSNE